MNGDDSEPPQAAVVERPPERGDVLGDLTIPKSGASILFPPAQKIGSPRMRRWSRFGARAGGAWMGPVPGTPKETGLRRPGIG